MVSAAEGVSVDVLVFPVGVPFPFLVLLGTSVTVALATSPLFNKELVFRRGYVIVKEEAGDEEGEEGSDEEGQEVEVGREATNSGIDCGNRKTLSGS